MLTNPQPVSNSPSAKCTTIPRAAVGPSGSEPHPQRIAKRILNMKSKRKKNLVKKAHELARIANLKITVVIYDK